MYKLYRFLSMVIMLAGLLACTKTRQSTTDVTVSIIPEPNEVTVWEGSFRITGNTSIKIESEDLNTIAAYLKEILNLPEIVTTIASEPASKQTIFLGINPELPAEGYKLEVYADRVSILGGDQAGIFYGIQTLRQLVSNDNTIQLVSIKDAPRFGYRGMMLDVGRHFYPVASIKEFIDLMALHKINTLHWHLTEDQGWRIEINKYPKLTEVGAFRNGTIVGHHPGTGNDQTPYGGFYSKQEIREIVAYASDRHMTIIPEIELPGHGSAAIAAYPFLSCFPDEPTIVFNDMMSDQGKQLQENGTPKVVQETWGVMDDVFCAGREETFTFLEAVLEETMGLFPSKYIHIGGDECPKANWERCFNCQARIKDLGLKDEHELQSYFIKRIEKFVNSKGKSIIGWDEIIEGGLSKSATVMYWRAWVPEVPGTVIGQKNDIIMTPNSHCYFDYYQVPEADQESEPLAIGGNLPVEVVYSFEPIPDGLPAEQIRYVLGAQANVWTEYMPSMEHIQYMTLPRMAALSEVAWSKKEHKDYLKFLEKLQSMFKLYDKLEINYAKHLKQ